MPKKFFVRGLIPAVFTPMKDDGTINLERIGPLVDHLAANHPAAFFICGSAGEGVSLTLAERKVLAKEFIQSAAGRAPVIVQVGHTSLLEARDLAADAAKAGADAICAILPSYFHPANTTDLVESLAIIASGAPDLPFYYYHIPALVDHRINTRELLIQAKDKLPSLVGIKYSTSQVFEIISLKDQFKDEYNILFGVDEMLFSGLVGNADGAVGSTYNWLLPLANQIVKAYHSGDIHQAEKLQVKQTELIRIVNDAGGLGANKRVMALIGQDCGPVRLPLHRLSTERFAQMESDLRQAGFFDWIHA